MKLTQRSLNVFLDTYIQYFYKRITVKYDKLFRVKRNPGLLLLYAIIRTGSCLDINHHRRREIETNAHQSSAQTV